MIIEIHPTTPACRFRWREVFLVFMVALVARAGFGFVRLQRSADPAALEFPDEHQFWFMAKELAQGNGLRDDMGFRATRMPLYPAYLSLFANQSDPIALAKASQWIIGALTASLIHMLGHQISGRGVGLMAGLVVAFDPFLIFFSSLLLTETLSITALCFLWLLLARVIGSTPLQESLGRWLAIGIAASVCVYLRESNLGLVLVAILFALWACRRSRRALLGGGAALVLVVISLLPWAARNHATLGEWYWLTTRAGISLYDGVGPQATGASDLGEIQRTGAAAELSETQWNNHFRQEAWSAIRNDPIRIIHLAGYKLVRMWNPLPNVEAYRSGLTRWISGLWAVPLFILAFVGTVRCVTLYRRNGLFIVAFLLLPAIYFSLLHSLYIGSVRYRIPAIPMFAVLAAMALIPRRDCDSAKQA